MQAEYLVLTELFKIINRNTDYAMKHTLECQYQYKLLCHELKILMHKQKRSIVLLAKSKYFAKRHLTFDYCSLYLKVSFKSRIVS